MFLCSHGRSLDVATPCSHDALELSTLNYSLLTLTLIDTHSPPRTSSAPMPGILYASARTFCALVRCNTMMVTLDDLLEK